MFNKIFNGLSSIGSKLIEHQEGKEADFLKRIKKEEYYLRNKSDGELKDVIRNDTTIRKIAAKNILSRR